jgi:hypothetical protein
VNGSANCFAENSVVCFFNSSGCQVGRLIQLIHSSSGFGIFARSAYYQLSVVQDSSKRLWHLCAVCLLPT